MLLSVLVERDGLTVGGHPGVAERAVVTVVVGAVLPSWLFVLGHDIWVVNEIVFCGCDVEIMFTGVDSGAKQNVCLVFVRGRGVDDALFGLCCLTLVCPPRNDTVIS